VPPKEPRGKERIRRWYAARSSADTAGLAKLSTQQSDKPRTDQPVRGKDRIRAMYNRTPDDA
jgi:hypothetical protein